MSKKDSNRVFDLLIYKNHYALVKKLIIFLGNHSCNYVCRKCLNSYTCQKMLYKHKEKCEQKQEIITIRTSDESNLYWKKLFSKESINF